MSEDTGPRVGVRTRRLTDERLRYVKQLGADDVFVDPLVEDEVNDPYLGRDADADPEGLFFPRDRAPTVDELVAVRERLADAGLRFAGIQTVPSIFYERIALGPGDGAAGIEWYRDLLRNAGAADVPIVGYQWCPGGVYRTEDAHPIRGGATATAYDHAVFEDSPGEAPDEDEMWARYERFLRTVLPVAEDAGVRLALHPDDPPTLERLEGIPRLFRNVGAFERAMDLVPSEAHGLKLCLGCFSEMPDADVEEVVRTFGERGDVAFVHFRDVVGTVPAFNETFVDAGNFDPPGVARALVDVGFDGVLIPDHVPAMEGDTDWGHRARGYTVGYLAGLLDAAADE